MRRPRMLLMAIGLLLAAGLVAGLWSVNHWPSPWLLVTYGFPPSGGPTGRTEVQSFPIGPEEDYGPPSEIVFVELSPGYVFIDRHRVWCDPGDFLGRICAPFRIPWGEAPRHGRDDCRYHAVVPETLWISRSSVQSALDDMAEQTGVKDDGDVRKLLEACSRHLPGLYRLATEREYDYALAHGAIEPDTLEHGLVSWMGGPPEEGMLLPPERSPDGFWSGIVHYRIVWEPDD